MSTQILPLTETVTPADEAAVAERLWQAHADGTPVYPIGGGTALDYGVRPTRPGLGLSLAEMNRVVDYPADDMTITVEAGTTIAKLVRRLAVKRQRLPVDVPHADRATVGGAVAANSSGPRRYALGTLRDYVIGLRAADGRGTPFSGGGRVVKNAAGYNLCRLMVGSLGTLGVVTEITLMVRPMIETSAMLTCTVADFEAAEELLAALVQTKTAPVAIELLAGSAGKDAPGLASADDGGAARLLVGFEGSRMEVDWMLEQLGREWQSAGVASATTIGAAMVDGLWAWLTDFPAQIQINALPSVTTGLIEQVLEADPQASILAHAGNGVIRAGLSPRGPKETAVLIRERLRPVVDDAGGRMTVLTYGDGLELTADDVWGRPGEGAAVSRAIKDRFDPAGILNPGRFAYEYADELADRDS